MEVQTELSTNDGECYESCPLFNNLHFFFFGRYFIVFILSAQPIKRSLVSAAVTEQTARSKVCCLPTLQSAPLCNFIEKFCYIVSARLIL